ncbi:nucleoside/nucleotide kinase family protein [Pelagovum pacificum]|uniref:Nucleoside/nucleotide kinase family protein n=1 Tax=Pelagovum pacificum TaxID=2588711 RepID=A0A5C5G807_9RHOB|nr:nucleoside/nucleotide kinase family protein [Pelagovum pacificum]QQA41876.1 nucleoside/nucleotide kinase family protein [Pelagovum pacificum]TNY30681.1 nucleoside/nucleotide kinase family protein [Pelagovum pacificum]
MLNVTSEVNLLAEAVHAAREDRQRVLVAIAGAPASGKSTLAAELLRRMRNQKVRAEVVPMDGFHLDNAVLEARGLKLRKGAPETFDSLGFLNAVRRLKEGEEVVLPLFDRPRDLAIAGAVVVEPDCQVVIVEGNYLLFDERPWLNLAGLWDISARIDVPTADLRSRLIQRWLSHGFSRTAATQRAERNDMPNALRVIEKSLPADFIL